MLCFLFDKTVDVLFRLAFFCFGSIETPKLAVSAKKRNNRNKCFVSDSAETSFGPSFGCFEAKLVSLDTLVESMKTTTSALMGPQLTHACSSCK